MFIYLQFNYLYFAIIFRIDNLEKIGEITVERTIQLFTHDTIQFSVS